MNPYYPYWNTSGYGYTSYSDWGYHSPHMYYTNGHYVSLPYHMPFPYHDRVTSGYDRYTRHESRPARTTPSHSTSHSRTVHTLKPTLAATPPKKDIFRDSLLRYAGYLNEVGESFRGIVSESTVRLSYLLSGLYVAADALDKGMKGFSRSRDQSPTGRTVTAVKEAVDAGLFQLGASIGAPSAVIYGAKWVTKKLLKQNHCKNPLLIKWLPTMIGLGLIPIIIKPLDHMMENVMNWVIRPILWGPAGKHHS